MKMGKKFAFFEEFQKDKETPEISTILNSITPLQMYCFDQTLFISCKYKTRVNQSYQFEPKILKIINNTVEDEYKPFNKLIYHFQLISLEGSHYFLCCGIDFNVFTNPEGQKESKLVTSIKIYDAGVLLSKTHKTNNNNIENYMIRQINLMKLTKDEMNKPKFYIGKDYPKEYGPVENIISFAVSKNFDKCAFGLELGKVILIRGFPNLAEASEKNLNPTCLDTIDTDLHITNLAFSELSNKLSILYATTTQEMFYYKINNKEEKIVKLSEDTGAYSGCIDTSGDKLLVATSTDNQILEYYNAELGPSCFFEGKKQMACYFKNYILFIVIDDNATVFAIYDNLNKFFAYYNQTFTKVFSIAKFNSDLYALVEINYSTKKIVRLVEIENRQKFELFYKRGFFDTALEYAKNLKFDKKKIAEINQRHGDHIFAKSNYQKAIEQYIMTIGYVDPSIIIQKFLDGSKLEYLIHYLEVLLDKDKKFKFRNDNENKDYTALLLNCYIKQKKIDKLRTFVEGKNGEDITPHLMNVEIAIEVCKEKHIDLALSIAEKSKLFETYITLLIDFKSKK